MKLAAQTFDRETSRRRRFGDWMIRVGLLMQVLFLVLVDWGTITGMLHSDEPVPMVHLVGLTVTNIVLFAASYVAWVWMRRLQTRQVAGES